MQAPASKKNPQIAVDEFNARYPIGVPVLVRMDNGQTRETKTRDKAWVMGGHSAVISLEGISGGYSLERVTPRPAPALKTPAKHGMPQKPGYYWAKWKIASEDTDDAEDCTPSNEWEVVQVNSNILGWETETDEENPERLSVSVLGVRSAQWRDCFVWGGFISELNPKLPAEGVAA